MARDVNKSLATARIGEEMQRRGWTIFGYIEDRSDSMSDYYSPASWRGGVATHHTWPGVVVGMDVYSTSRSGQDDTSSEWVPAEPCGACSGIGIQVGALTYQEALANPDEAHKNKREREDGWRIVRFGGPAVNRHDYHEDGSAKCVDCHGRGHDLREVKTVICTWPTFQATPKGKSWHVEVDGKIHETGVGLSHCDGYSGWEASVQRMVKDIEAAVTRAHAAHSRRIAAAVTAAAIGDTSLLPTQASGHGFTVKVEYEALGSDVKSIITTIPRLPKPDWYHLRDGFGVSYDRKTGEVSKWKFVTAQDVFDFLRPPTIEELAERTSAAAPVETAVLENPEDADPIAVAEAYTPPQQKNDLFIRIERRENADGTTREVGILDTSSLAQPDPSADEAEAADMRYLLINADRLDAVHLNRQGVSRQIGGYIVYGVSAPHANAALISLMQSIAHASPKVYNSYDEVVAEAKRMDAEETWQTVAPVEVNLLQTYLGEALQAEAFPIQVEQVAAEQLAVEQVEVEVKSAPTAAPIYMIITLPYDREQVLPPNTKPFAKCGDFEIIQTDETEIDALYAAMNNPDVKASGTTMKYSSEFACFDEAVAKAQQVTFNRKNLNCLTEGRNGKLQQYNPLTDACSVEFYTKTVTEAAPAVEEASAVAEIAEIEQAMAQDPAVALAVLVYDISLLENNEIAELAQVKKGEADDFQQAWCAWVKQNPGAIDETVAGACARYIAFLNTPTSDSRWLVALADANAYLGFSARWDDEAMGRWRLIRVEQRDVQWQAMRLASGIKGGMAIHTDRVTAETEMLMQHELDTPRQQHDLPQIEAVPTEAPAEVVEASLWSESNPAWLNELFSVKDWGDEKTARKQRDQRVKQLRAYGWQVTVKAVTVMDSRWFELVAKARGFDGPIITYGGSKGSSSSTWVKPETVQTLYQPQATIQPVLVEAGPVEAAPVEVEVVQVEAAPQPESTLSFKATTPKAKRDSKVALDTVQWVMF